MKLLLMPLIVLLFGASPLSLAQERFERCLPEGIKAGTVVSAQPVHPGVGDGPIHKVMVRDRLIALKARCRKGRLVDRFGKEIYFYRLKGCWGNPPANYQEVLERQRGEIARLKKRYTVVELTCNPDGTVVQ